MSDGNAKPQSSAESAATASPWRHLPNALTALRIVLVAPLTASILLGHYPAALLIAAFAGASDALDGWLAKHFGWQSWIGGVLDPIADKLMLIGCFVALGHVDAHPAWLTALVVGRDLVIVAGAVAYHCWVGRIHAQPTLLSKCTTCVQIGFVLLELVARTHWLELPRAAQGAAVLVTALMTLASGVQYVVIWSSKAFRARTVGGRR